MKLHSPAFEKALRRGVRKAVRASPELKKEYRKAGRFRQRRLPPALIRICFCCVLAMLTSVIAPKTHQPASILAFINLWTLGSFFFTMRALLTCLYQSNDIRALVLLPVSEDAIFRWEVRKFFRKAIVGAGDMIAGFGALALIWDLPRLDWLVVLTLAAAAWAMLLALALFCAARWPALPYHKVCGYIAVAGLVVFFGRDVIWQPLLSALDAAAPTLNVILPTGWVPSLFQLLLPHRDWTTLVLLIPMGFLAWNVRDSLDRLRGRYHFQEATEPEAGDVIPSEDFEVAEPAGDWEQPSPRRAGLTAIEIIVSSREFLAPEQWQHRGLFERWLWQWLTPRERALAEFAFPRGVAITRGLWTNARIFVGMALLGFAAGLSSKTAERWIMVLGLFTTISLALGLILQNGVAFRAVQINGVSIPIHAALPIGFRELSRLLLKYSVVQAPGLVFFYMICGGLVTHLWGAGFGAGIVPGLKVAFLLYGARFILVGFNFSSGIQFRWRTLLISTVLSCLVFIFVICGAVSIFWAETIEGWLCLGGALCAAYVFWILFARFNNANRFDLMTVRLR